MRPGQQVIEQQFICRRCNECCRKPGLVYLEYGEEDHIAQYLQQDVRDFVENFCELQERARLVLKKHPDEACIFLTGEGCSIHPVKPRQCREFPVRWRTEQSFDYCKGLKRISFFD